jgi:class 3 adenylate cyclase/tetratricopeptide (TPR) repeat protein
MSSDAQVEMMGFVPRWLRQRLQLGWGEPEARIEPMRAAMLFADIAGFSALTREFSLRGDAGLEELTVAVSDYFGRLFDHVTAAGGYIENTYGDGFLAFWPADAKEIAAASQNAWRCALQLTANFDRFRIGPRFEFRLRAAVLEGHVFAVKAGGAGGHWLFFLGGDCLSEVSGLLATAEAGGVAPSSSVVEALGEVSTSTAARLDDSRIKEPEAGAALAALPNSQMLPFLPRVLQRADGRLTEGWLAQFRLLSILFLRFPELHCREAGDLNAIQTVVAKAQEIVGRHDGAILRASMNDKGPFILCAFGLPQNAHEDDPQRAEAAAWALNAEFRAAGVAARCTVTEGIVYCGMIGRSDHYSYTTMGEAVNRAAKLAAAADLPEVIVDLRSASAGPIPVSPAGHEAQSRSALDESARPIGREPELRWLAERIDALVAGSAHRAILISGEAGIGKTTLLREMARCATGVTVLRSAADSLVGGTTPYAIWRRIFRELFADDGTAGSPELTEALGRRLARQGEDACLADLAGAVLQLAPSVTDAGRFSPTDRARLTRAALVALLKDRLSTERAVLMLENAHWADAASWSLAGEIAMQVPQALLVITSRLQDDSGQPLAGTSCERLSLQPLAEDETQSILAKALNCRGVTADVVQLVHGRAAGNPLFTTQLGLALLESRVLAIDNGRLRFGNQSNAAQASALSDTVQRVIVSRVDRLPAAVQQTLKAASVVGESFDLSIVQALVPREDVADHLDRLTALGLVRRLPNEGEWSYQFNHGVTREVMYRQMAFAQRRRLHELAAKACEAMKPMPADAVLGHHWLGAEMADRAIPCWERAGYAAFAAGAFAEAAASFEKALSCLAGMPGFPGRAVRAARLYRHAGEACLQIGNIGLSRQYLVQALGALDRQWPVGNLSMILALSREILRQILLERTPRHSSAKALMDETASETAQVYESLGHVLGHLSELNLMGLAALSALNISQRSGNRQIYSRACGLLSLALLLIPIPAVARRYFHHCIDARPTRSEPHDWLMTTEYLALYSMTVADFERAETDLLEMLEVGHSANNRRRRLDAMSLLSVTLMCRGEFGRCERILAAFEREVLNERDPQVLCWAHLEQAELALMRGDTASALRQVDGSKDLLQTLGRTERLWGEGLRALALWRNSRTDDALAAASVASGHLRNPNEIPFYAGGGAYGAAEVFIEALRTVNPTAPDGAIASDAHRMMRRLRRFGLRLPICRPRTLMLLGRYQLALGHQRRGISLLRQAREEAVRQRRPYEEALTVVHLAAAGSRTTPESDEAMRSLREMGAERMLQHLPAIRSAP